MLQSLAYSEFCEKTIGSSKESSLLVIKSVSSVIRFFFPVPNTQYFCDLCQITHYLFVTHFLPLEIEIRLSTLCHMCLVSIDVNLPVV